MRHPIYSVWNKLYNPANKKLTAALFLASKALSGELLLWYRFNELAGNAINYGALGTAFNGTITGPIRGQTGQLGPNEAFLFDGANDFVSAPASALHGNLNTFTRFLLFNPSGTGAGNSGRLYSYGTSDTRLSFDGTANRRLLADQDGTTDAISNTNNVLTLSSWYSVFVTYDDAGDRKLRLYYGKNGVVTEASYSSQVAMTGVITSQAASALFFGARGVPDQGYAGLIDEAGVVNKVWPITTMQTLTSLWRV